MHVRLVLPGDKGGDDPKDDKQPCYLYITRSCIDKGRKKLAIQKKTENLVLLAFVFHGLVWPGDEGGDDPKDDKYLYITSSCIDKGERC
jgi:hypothetical protein